jgi:hypothetical protein
MKKLMICAALAAIAATALPATALAVWTDNHSDIPANTNPQIHGEGTGFAFQSIVGGITCTTVTATIQLTGGQTTGHLNQYSVNNPQSQCHTEGGVIGHCTVTSIQAIGLPWTAHTSNKTGIRVTGVHYSKDLHGFLCPDVTLELVPTEQQQQQKPYDYIEITAEENSVVGPHATIDALIIEGTVTATPLQGPFQVAGTITATAGQQDRYGWT